MEIRNSPEGYVPSVLAPSFTKPCHSCHRFIESCKPEKATWTRVDTVMARLPQSTGLPLSHLTLRPFPQSFDVLLVLAHDQATHNDGEEDKPACRAYQTGEERE